MIDLYSSNVKFFKFNYYNFYKYNNYDVYVRDIEREYIKLKYGFTHYFVIYFYRFKTHSEFLLLFDNHSTKKLSLPPLILYYSDFPISYYKHEYVYKRKNGTIITKLTNRFSVDSSYKPIKKGYKDGFNNSLVYIGDIKILYGFNKCLVGLGIQGE